MNLKQLVARASDKDRFKTIEAYVGFARSFLDYAADHLQAVIVSRNEPHYNFWQFKKEGGFNVSRPSNSNLMFTAAENEPLTAGFWSSWPTFETRRRTPPPSGNASTAASTPCSSASAPP